MSYHTKELQSGELCDELFDFKRISWKIPNVLSVPFEKDFKVTSPPFAFGGATWKLAMYPYGQTKYGTEGHIDLLLQRMTYEIPNQEIFYEFSLETRNKKEFEPCSNHYTFSRTYGEDSGVIGLMPTDAFLNKKNILCRNEAVTVICEIRTKKIPTKKILGRYTQTEASSTITAIDSTLKPNSPDSSHGSKILYDFKTLFLNTETSDVVIKVKCREFPAHKAILMVRSPVLASAFRNDMKEKSTGVINIEDCDPSIFSDFLRFLYCGEIENLSSENASSLFTVADKYDVLDLRFMCLKFMKKNLTIDTFCDTIVMALQHSEAELLKVCKDFFAKNLQKIIVTDKWQSFVRDNPTQSNELLISALVIDSNKNKNA